MKILNLLYLFLLVLITYSCVPSLNMSINPTTVCPGEEFEVDWNSEEVPPPTVETSSPTDPPFSGELSSNGKISLKAETTTRITMTSTHKGKLYEKIIDVHVVSENELIPLSFDWSGCIVAQGQRVGYKSIADLSMGSGPMVMGVRNTSGRHIRLSHNGVVDIPLEPEEVSNKFNTETYKGEWSVRRDPLLGIPNLGPFRQEGCPPRNETNPDPSITYVDPPSISVAITIGCN